MDENGYDQVTPRRAARPSCRDEPFIDLQSGYVLRSIDQFPKQGDDAPWRLYQNYARDMPMLRRGADRGRRASVQACARRSDSFAIPSNSCLTLVLTIGITARPISGMVGVVSIR